MYIPPVSYTHLDVYKRQTWTQDQQWQIALGYLSVQLENTWSIVEDNKERTMVKLNQKKVSYAYLIMITEINTLSV